MDEWFSLLIFRKSEWISQLVHPHFLTNEDVLASSESNVLCHAPNSKPLPTRSESGAKCVHLTNMPTLRRSSLLDWLVEIGRKEHRSKALLR